MHLGVPPSQLFQRGRAVIRWLAASLALPGQFYRKPGPPWLGLRPLSSVKGQAAVVGGRWAKVKSGPVPRGMMRPGVGGPSGPSDVFFGYSWFPTDRGDEQGLEDLTSP